MKVKESFWHEAAKADKNDKANWSNDDAAARRRQTASEQTNAANKSRAGESPVKDETKFSNLLESPAKLQKPNQRQEESGEQHRDDQKKEKKHVDKEKDSTRLDAASDGKTEKYESSTGGQTGGGQSGFGTGANVGQLNLSENFAARSILHIADLERLVSTVRSQINLGGRREIVLQLKRSVLDGLQVKITTDSAARVAVEFLAANETVRAQIAGHSQELAEILRGRGINLGSLTASLDANGENQNSSDAESDSLKVNSTASGDDLSTENTFDAPLAGDKIYQA
jgi:hypothetical protein